MFSGRFEHALDEKGRVSIPARFREILDREGHDRLFITNNYFHSAQAEPVLELYPPTVWDRLLEKVSTRTQFDPEIRAFETFFIGGAFEMPVDRQGRMLIPESLRVFAGLDRDVTFSAVRDHFQLWDRARLDRVLDATREKFRDPKFFEKLNL